MRDSSVSPRSFRLPALLALLPAAAGCGGINVSPSDAGAPDVADTSVPDVGQPDVSEPDVTVPDVTIADVTTADVTTADVADTGSTLDAQPPPDVVEEPPPVTPGSLPSSELAFWFDPTSLLSLNGQVTKWRDLSGNGNDAVQSVTGYEPAYTASGIGGLPSATFTGPITFLAIADVASMQWETSDFLILAVVRATADTTSPEAMIYQKTGMSPFDGASLYLNADKPNGFTSLCAAQVSGGTYVVSVSPPATYVDSSVHVLGAYRAANTLEIRVDGKVSNETTSAAIGTTNVSSTGFAAIIGQNGYNTPQAEFQQVHGDIAEMIGVRGTMNPATVGNLEQYLKTRYGIP